MSKNGIIAIVVIIVIVIIGMLVYARGNDGTDVEDSEVSVPLTNEEGQVSGDNQNGAATSSTGTSVEVGASVGVTTGSVKEFTIDGSNFMYSMPKMTVKQGDTVRVKFVNTEGFHDFRIDEFSVATDQINAGESDTVEFVADKAGTFEYYCSVGSHRAMGMKGTLVVEV